jgi:hypothetical protein
MNFDVNAGNGGDLTLGHVLDYIHDFSPTDLPFTNKRLTTVCR